MSWVVLSLIVSLLWAVAKESNHFFKIDGLLLSFVIAGTTVVMISPLLFFVTWPNEPFFYLFFLTFGAMTVIGDKVVFNAAAQYGGRVVSLYTATKLISVFFIWSAWDVKSWHALTENSWVFWGVLSCLCVSVSGVIIMSRNKLCWPAFLQLAPIGFLMAFGDGLTKAGMDYTTAWSGAVLFAFLGNVGNVIFSGPWCYIKYRKGTLPFAPAKILLKAGVFLGLIYGVIMGLGAIAFSLSPNPAYVQAMVLLNAVWLMIYYRFIGREDPYSPWAGLLFIIGSAGLIVLVN